MLLTCLRGLARSRSSRDPSLFAELLERPPPVILRILALRARRDAWSKDNHEFQARRRAEGHKDWAELPERPEHENFADTQLHDDYVEQCVIGLLRHGDGDQARWLVRRDIRRIDAATWLALVGRHGRLPEHVLFLLPALSDDSQHVVPAAVTGGGDEVYESDLPRRGQSALATLVQRTSEEAVRAVLVRACVEHDGLRDADEALRLLGGPTNADVQAIVDALARDPANPTALAFLADLGAELEVARVWQARAVPWWPCSATPMPVEKPVTTPLELLVELYGDAPEEFRRFISASFTAEPARQLLTQMTSRQADPASQYESALAALERHGLLDYDFFTALTRDRPGRRDVIERVADAHCSDLKRPH